MKSVPAKSPKQQTTRRCHWVPQAYLKAWAVAPGNTPRVWRFSRMKGEPELKRIDKVAVKHHLYAPRDAAGNRDDALEKKLSELENLYRDPIWRSLQTDMVDLSWEPLRVVVSLLAATMFLRTPLQLERHRLIHKGLVDAGQSGEILITDLDDWESFRDAGEDGIKRMWMSEIDGAGYYADIMKQMRWSVLMSEQPNIITSDNPVTFNHPSLGFRGIKNLETSIMLPLSPTRMLVMDHLYREPHNQYHPIKYPVASLNLLMWRGAIEHMFTNRNPDEVCRELEADAKTGGFI